MPKSPRKKLFGQPCKIGTMPELVYIDRRCRVKVGKKIRVREAMHGSKWFRVLVIRVADDGYFRADRI